MPKAGMGQAQLKTHLLTAGACAAVAIGLWVEAFDRDRAGVLVLIAAATLTLIAAVLGAGCAQQRMMQAAMRDLRERVSETVSVAVAASVARHAVAAVAPRPNDGGMGRSDYYKVYADVLQDLAGLEPGDEAGAN